MEPRPAPGQRRDLFAFDRSDRLGLAGLLVLVALAALWAWVVGPVVAWVKGDAIPVQLTSAVQVPELEAVGVRPGTATYEVLLRDPDTTQRLLALAPGALYLAIVLGVCWAVWRVMRSIAAGDPFRPANVTWLRLAAALMVFGTAVAFFLDLSTRGALQASLDTGGLPPGFTFSLPWLPMVGGMVVALLAEAFKAGSRLRDDVEGLV